MRRTWSRLALPLPVLSLWGLLFLAPLVVLVLYSFGTADLITYRVSWGWTLDGYRQIADPVISTVMTRSLLLALATVGICVLLGLPMAFFISRLPGSWQSILILAVVLPFWVSFIVRTYAWVGLLQNGGPVERVLRGLGIGSGSLDLLYTPGSILIGMVCDYLPLMILPIYVALERIDPALEAAASDLGATSNRILRRVTLPLAAPGITAGCLLVGIPAAGEYVVPAILGGGKSLMLGNIVFDAFIKTGDYPFGSALAVVFMLGVTLLLLLPRLMPSRSAR